MTPNVNLETRSIEYSAFNIFETLRTLFESIFGTGFVDWFAGFWEVYSIIALLLALLFFVGFIYARIRFAQLSDIERGLIEEGEVAWAHLYGSEVSESNRWDDVKRNVATENPNDWRLAIIEADVILEETLTEHGYVGVSVGEMLKSAPESFQTIRDAWDGHMVRNKIAHTGTDFVLTKKLAQDTVVQYERVLNEFGAI